tara:strand:+ start:458 stop:562 length:105 start_codon:yes stop_codon:yes gene_type:complete
VEVISLAKRVVREKKKKEMPEKERNARKRKISGG